MYGVKTCVTNTVRKAYAINKNVQLTFSINESVDYDRKKISGNRMIFFFYHALPKVKCTVSAYEAGIRNFRLAYETILQFIF